MNTRKPKDTKHHLKTMNASYYCWESGQVRAVKNMRLSNYLKRLKLCFIADAVEDKISE